MFHLTLILLILQSCANKIAFGSCYNRNDPKTIIFREILKHNPTHFIWLGDAAYVTIPQKIPDDNYTRIEEVFNETYNHPDYTILRQTTKIEGVWDDHDYNQNDGIYSNPTKHHIRELYLNFLEVSKQDSRRTNQNGIYYSFMADGQTKLILLDVRWNRNPQEQDILGEAQWHWLECQLQSNELQYIIGSGSQMLPDDRLFIDVWYDKSRSRLLSLLQNKKAFIITGDVHFAEILQDPCSGIIEVTSSGLSTPHHYKNFLRGLFEFYAKLFQPDSYSDQSSRFPEVNYGIIDIDERKIQLFGEKGLLKETSFYGNVDVEKCNLMSDQKIKRYFWNLFNKLSYFPKMRLFRQILMVGLLIISGLFVFVMNRKRKEKRRILKVKLE